MCVSHANRKIVIARRTVRETHDKRALVVFGKMSFCFWISQKIFAKDVFRIVKQNRRGHRGTSFQWECVLMQFDGRPI